MAKKAATGDNKAITNLQKVPGVGKATAQKLVGAGIKTGNQLAKASMKKLLAAGLSSAMAKKLVASAAKSTGKKVVEKAKAAPKATAKKRAKSVGKITHTFALAAARRQKIEKQKLKDLNASQTQSD